MVTTQPSKTCATKHEVGHESRNQQWCKGKTSERASAGLNEACCQCLTIWSATFAAYPAAVLNDHQKINNCFGRQATREIHLWKSNSRTTCSQRPCPSMENTGPPGHLGASGSPSAAPHKAPKSSGTKVILWIQTLLIDRCASGAPPGTFPQGPRASRDKRWYFEYKLQERISVLPEPPPGASQRPPLSELPWNLL